MVRVGYHASHEQFPPSELLECVVRAERAGFQAVMCSDHFHPWGTRQGQSGFAWSWLGAALHATSLPFGVVTSPVGWRYHPAVVAQAAATLCEMFPDRFWLAAGSGENLNEHVVAQRWPSKEERNERLGEAVRIMRALFAGEEVTARGVIPTDRARLFTRPPRPPRIVGAALSVETARWAGGWADALITINLGPDKLRRVVEAFREGGGHSKPVLLQAHLSYARTEEEALASAMDQWSTNAFPGSVSESLATPAQFDALFDRAREEDVRRSVHVSADPEAHAEWLRSLVRLGIDEVYLHNVGRNQREFIEAFGERVVPALAEGARLPASRRGA